ncbi:hypothetical protein A6769_39240 [Nostoc punctiforme NIES-2108]|uniref:Uncharacterized protein n=1 Tax=Nostoc punctiforme NIES-2108 TaxID=1356359 RepID=A0A367RZ27_NOSPU|nr:hypothetical protein A6769_39240 [Nostoc punctiforme NIES-2108]
MNVGSEKFFTIRQQLIDLWVRKQQQANADITLLCFEKTEDFCPMAYCRLSREWYAYKLETLAVTGYRGVGNTFRTNPTISLLVCKRLEGKG